MNLIKSFQMVCLAAVAGLLATGCQTYKQQNKAILFWQQGNVNAAVAEAKKNADDNANNKDAIIWRLEQGAVLRAAGQFADSNQAFDEAQAKIDDYAQKAKVRVGQEAGALISNQAELDYEGRSYDGIMLNTYKALNYLALGETDKARPEIIRAYQRQQDAVEANKKRIEATQDAAAKSKDKAAIEKAQNDGKLQAQLAGATAGLDGLQAYANYVNPFTVYLDGLYFLANAADASDLERAHKSLERVVSFAPNNGFVQQDLAAADAAIGGQPLAPTTYVVFETGCAPMRDQIRIDIPIIVSSVSYVGAAFPTLKLQGNYLPSLTVTTSETNLTTALVASVDGMVALDFKNELPVVISKTIAATVTKAVAAYALNQAAEQGGGEIGGLFAKIATAGYQMAVNIADTRTWTTLPKEFQVARLPTPADHKITLSGPGGGPGTEVTVEDGAINLVYVKSINTGCPLLVTKMKLNGAPLRLASGVGGGGSAAVNSVPGPGASPVAPTPPAAPAAVPAASVAPATPAAAPAAPAPAPNPGSSMNSSDNHGAATAAMAPAPISPEPSAPGALALATTAPNQTEGAKIVSHPEVERLCEGLKSDKPRVVIQALKSLRRLDATEAVPQILSCLNSHNAGVLRDACRTLAVLGNKDTIPALQPLLLHHRKDIRKDARAAIAKLQTKPSSANRMFFNC